MPIEPQDIGDRESFKQWLDERPAGVRRKTAIVLASRLAARVLPVLTRSGRQRDLGQFADLSLPVFRANLISRAAAKISAREIRAAAAAASDAAAADAAAAAYSAYSAAAIWEQLRLDVDLLLLKGATALLRRPLWNEAPGWWHESLGEFRKILPSSEWQVWFDWYDSIAAGKPAFGLPAKLADALEKRIALGDGSDDFWNREPGVINAEIAGWVAEARGISAIPKAQNSGLRFGYSDGKVRLARGPGLSSENDDQQRLNQQLPQLRKLVVSLDETLKAREAPYPGLLLDTVADFREMLQRPPKDVGVTELFTMASVLRGQIEAARKPAAHSNAPPLEGQELALAQSISMISDLIVLATLEGRKLFDDADRAAVDAGIDNVFREKMLEFLDHLRSSAQLIDPEAFALLLNLFSLDITAPNPKRVGFLQRGSARNLLIALTALGLVAYAGPAILGGTAVALFLVDKLSGGGLSESDFGKYLNKTVRDAINAGTDELLDANREWFRELAKQPSLRWLGDVLDKFEELERIRKDTSKNDEKR